MRDKYVEIIKEYIQEKPEYKSTLNELKACVLTIGATEEEFDEAIKQTSGLPNTSLLMLQENLKKSPNYHPKTRKRYFVALIITIIVVGIFGLLNITNTNYSISVMQNSPTANKPILTIQTHPYVYANSKPIDPEKIFSIKSTSDQLTVTGKPEKEVLGFFPYWMLPEANKINLNTLTSISLFGLEINRTGNIVTTNEAPDGWSMWKDSKLDDFIVKTKAQGLKVYLTLKCFNNSNIESITKSDLVQKNLIENALYYVNSKSLNGINIDFEYVGNPTDDVRNGFTRLITNLNSELKRQIPQSVLTVDTYLVSGSEKQLFDLPLLAKNVDAFVIMGYDMHTPFGGPGPISAMGGDTNIVDYVQNYLEQVDSSKLILAVPYYGYDWPKDIASPSENTVKILSYAEIAQQSQDLQLSWDEAAQTPYFTYKDDANQDRIVYFDNVRSLGIKYDFINRKNLKGVGIWTLGYDGQNQDLKKLLIDKFINQ